MPGGCFYKHKNRWFVEMNVGTKRFRMRVRDEIVPFLEEVLAGHGERMIYRDGRPVCFPVTSHWTPGYVK